MGILETQSTRTCNLMNDTEKKLLRHFFGFTANLIEAGIVRSDKILGDIAEWLCVKNFGLVLCQSSRQTGFDGYIGTSKVQVKMHNSPEGTNLSVGTPSAYDELIVIIGPRSKLRINDVENCFLAYRFSSEEVTSLMKRSSGFYCAKTVLS